MVVNLACELIKDVNFLLLTQKNEYQKNNKMLLK